MFTFHIWTLTQKGNSSFNANASRNLQITNLQIILVCVKLRVNEWYAGWGVFKTRAADALIGQVMEHIAYLMYRGRELGQQVSSQRGESRDGRLFYFNLSHSTYMYYFVKWTMVWKNSALQNRNRFSKLSLK